MAAEPLEALIFDFDGTLAVLNLDFDLMRQRVREMARARGYAGAWPAGHLLEEVAGLTRSLGPEFARAAEEIIGQVELEAAARGELFPFSRPLLASAGERGLAVGIITRNSGGAVRRVFPDLALYCRAFVPREEAPRPKPHPEHILIALARLGLAPERAAMVGDHPTDMEAARAAGCLGVGVASGRTGEEELWRAGAQVVLPSAGELLTWLDAREAEPVALPAGA
ncbi:MAG: HAD family hydrolase [Deltaproteobacteria bacterium]|nr:HAD family hydrolase [Deltaproteobacteria bacterium]